MQFRLLADSILVIGMVLVPLNVNAVNEEVKIMKQWSVNLECLLVRN